MNENGSRGPRCFLQVGEGERGATLAEYALVVSLIAMVSFALIVIIGLQVNQLFQLFIIN